METTVTDLTGQVFWKWTVIGPYRKRRDKDGRLWTDWLCRCYCGTEKWIEKNELLTGHSKQCIRHKGEHNLKHGMAGNKRIGTTHPMFRVWSTMKDRCIRPNTHNFNRYGGRGIRVCERWMEFANFLLDMGQTYQYGLTLERKDNNGDYCPSNCRWATRKEQANNRRSNRLIEINGTVKNLSQWSEQNGISCDVVRYREKKGLSTEKAITLPTHHGRRLWRCA